MHLIQTNGKLGYIDIRGRVRIAPKFEDAFEFAEGLAPVKLNNKWGYISDDGPWKIEPVFEEADEFSDSIAAVRINTGKVGYIDHSGKFAIPAEFDFGGLFREGLASVIHNKKRSIVNKAGEHVQTWIYDFVGYPFAPDLVLDFSGGLAASEWVSSRDSLILWAN
jgi:hypothetical protein